MSEANRNDAVDVERLLAGAARAIGKAQYCWLGTTPESGGGAIRPMGRLPPDPDDDAWKIRFVTDGRSGKAADMRRAGAVSIVFQHDPELAFIALRGKATLHDSRAEVQRRWKDAYNIYFPSEVDRANAIFVEVVVERMDLWIRGVTPEPFGMRTTTLARDAGGGWRAIAG